MKLDELSKTDFDEQRIELLNHLISEFESNDIDLAEIHTIEDEHKRLINNKSPRTIFKVSN